MFPQHAWQNVNLLLSLTCWLIGHCGPHGLGLIISLPISRLIQVLFFLNFTIIPRVFLSSL